MMYTIPTPKDLKRYRKRLKITQTKLAKKAGISQSLIARIEAGNIDPRTSTLKKILEVLKSEDKDEKLHVEQIMKTPVIHVVPEDTVGYASQLMEKYSISQLPVLENDVQVGSISDSKVVKEFTFDDPSKISIKKVGAVMNESFPTVSKKADIRSISSLVDNNPAVLIVEKGRVVGIVTRSDLLKLMGK